MPLNSARIGERALQRVIFDRERRAKAVEVAAKHLDAARIESRSASSPRTTCSDARASCRPR